MDAVAIYEKKYPNKKITIINARFAKPFDKELLLKLIKAHKFILTIEEGASYGFGAAISIFLIKKIY